MDVLNAMDAKGFLVVVIGLLTALIKTFKFIKEGEKGIKLRFGKAVRDGKGNPKIIEPGFVMLIPFVESLQRHHVRQQTIRMSDQRIMTEDHLIFNVSAMVNFRVKDIYKALFEIDNLDTSLVDLSMAILRDILSKKKYTDLAEMEKISSELLSSLETKAEEWGVTFEQFKLTDCAPTAETASLVTAETGVQLKLTALKKAAEMSNVSLADIPEQLAAVLMGAPLVAAVTQEMHVHEEGAKKKTQGFLAMLLGGDHKKQGNSKDNQEDEDM